MSQKWAVAVVGYRVRASCVGVEMFAFVVEADTGVMARGAGLVLGQRLCPPNDGWQVGVSVHPADVVIDPARPVTVTDSQGVSRDA